MITEDNFSILIPARKGSKGLPFKNRILFEYTANTIPEKYKKDTFVSTDDELIEDMSKKYGFNLHKRSKKSATDTATSKNILEDFACNSKEYLITLYLTYPERKWLDIESGITFFNKHNSKSLLCKKKLKVSPYLMMYELENNKGKQIINHNLCRRQDYKPCFEISHFISIININELSSLNNNLYNENTNFMSILDVEDIDDNKNLENFYEKRFNDGKV